MTARALPSSIGISVPRLEDDRMLAGAARYIDDLVLPGMLTMAVLRSGEAHARIVSIDATPALDVDGVVDAFTGRDLAQPLPKIPMRLMPLESSLPFLQTPIATDKVRYVGEPMAVIVAETRFAAEDGLEHVDMDTAELPPIVTMDAAEGASGNALSVPDTGSNVSARYTIGRGDTDDAFARAPYRRRERFHSHRQTAAPMETRGMIAHFDVEANKLRIWGATKVTFFNRRHLAEAFGLAEDDVELHVTDVGGSFGVRGELYPEYYLAAEASRRTGRPVKWIEDRREHFAATNHSRDVDCDLEIAAERDGTIVGMRAVVRADMGAYVRTNGNVVPVKAAQFLPGPYRVPNFACEVKALITNKTPVGTYRGPGRIEANFFRERMVDLMASDLGLDPAEVRFRNLVTVDQMPFPIGDLLPDGSKVEFDSGDYSAAFTRLLQEAGYEGWKGRQGELRDGRRHALGIACFNESSGGGRFEAARIRIGPDGTVTVSTGGASMGQGIETAMAQLCGDALGLSPADIKVDLASTTLLSGGVGTFHSRSTLMGGNAVRVAAERLIEETRADAARLLNAPAACLLFAQGRFARPDDPERTVSLAEIAAERGRAGVAEGINVEARYEQEKLAFSYGAHAAHVAVDTETGEVDVLEYWVVEDIGRVLNPDLVAAQTVGGVVQGLGGAFFDAIVYDAHGQLLTASFADYLVPTSTETPKITAIATEDHPSPHNPYGFKGAGEGGVVAVAAAVGNAIARAIGPDGAKVRATPFSPDAIRGWLRSNALSEG